MAPAAGRRLVMALGVLACSLDRRIWSGKTGLPFPAGTQLVMAIRPGRTMPHMLQRNAGQLDQHRFGRWYRPAAGGAQHALPSGSKSALALAGQLSSPVRCCAGRTALQQACRSHTARRRPDAGETSAAPATVRLSGSPRQQYTEGDAEQGGRFR